MAKTKEEPKRRGSRLVEQLPRPRKKKTRSRPGAPPGTIRHDPALGRPRLDVIGYGPEGFEEADVSGPEELAGWMGRHAVLWINVVGLGDAEVVRAVGELAGVHKLALEDAVNVHQRPKCEAYGEDVFVVARMPHAGEALETEQLSVFVKPGLVVTFQERPEDTLGHVRDRLRRSSGRLRQTGSDYLAYAILDALVDGYFPVLDDYGERLEGIEDEMISAPTEASVQRLHQARRDLLTLRRAIWPLREAVSALLREPIAVIGEDTRLYLRDCYDHTIQIMDLVETYRELASGLMDIYLSSVSNRMNEVMKILTVIATIFIPLTFIAGVYGMNFDPALSPWSMPELRSPYGYPIVMGVMALLAVVMLLFFRRRGWLGGTQRPSDDR